MKHGSLTFVCGGKQVPASRFRVHPIAERFAADGWDTRVLHGYGDLDQTLPDGVLRRAYRAGCRLRRAYETANLVTGGPVLVQRLGWPWSSVPEQILSRRSNQLIFDFDDAVFLNGQGVVSASRQKALKGVFAASAHVVAGNHWLAETVGNTPVTVIPTCIDTSYYVPGQRHRNSSRVHIGWIGTSSNFKYLEQLIEPFRILRDEGYCFDFTICSDVEKATLVRSLGAKFIRWSAGGELSFLQSIDIGLMPLFDDDWCRGKCSFKIIQYMSVGCAVVASAVGFNNDVVEEGVQGYLVGPDGWTCAIKDLLDEPERRWQFGLSARERATAAFDIESAYAGYKQIVSDVA